MESLESQVASFGCSWQDLRYIVFTHVHPDHYGLTQRLVGLTHAQLVMHTAERDALLAPNGDDSIAIQELDEWLRSNGTPDAAVPTLRRTPKNILGIVSVPMSYVIVQDGEHLRFGPYDFEFVWTPGHSPGHICVLERERRLLFCGDHLLSRVTPSVNMEHPSLGNLVSEYYRSLKRTAALPVERVLPGHGDTFSDIVKRSAEVEEQHERRMRMIAHACSDGPRSAYEISQVILARASGKGRPKPPPFIQRMVIAETISHLEMLASRGKLIKTVEDGIVHFATSKASG